MKTISLCMIVKNEEKVIENCLKSIYDLVDEIIIVDTGSTDKTKEICRKYTNNVFDFEWDYDFSAARNYSFSKATSDYILWLDADDILLDKDREKFKTLKENMDGIVDVYECIYNYRHDENGVCTYSFPRQRIVRNCETSYWTCIVHELLNVKSDISEETDIIITHTSNHENSKKYIDYFEIKINKGHKLSSREKFFYGGELMFTGQKEKALPYLEDFINDKFYNNIYELSRAHNYLGMYYQNNGQYIKAINHYLNQISYNEPDIETYYNIANCYNLLSDFKNAKFYFESILSLNFNKEKFMNGSEFDIKNLKNTINEFKINSLLFLCIIYYNEGNIEKSIECNNKVLLLDKANESACFNDEYFRQLKRGE